MKSALFSSLNLLSKSWCSPDCGSKSWKKILAIMTFSHCFSTHVVLVESWQWFTRQRPTQIKTLSWRVLFNHHCRKNNKKSTLTFKGSHRLKRWSFHMQPLQTVQHKIGIKKRNTFMHDVSYHWISRAKQIIDRLRYILNINVLKYYSE